MEQSRFDHFTQSLATLRSRRAAITAGVMALIAAAPISSAGAKPKKK